MFHSITKLSLFPQGLRASVVFVRQEKANKFKLNANTVIPVRVALTVTFSIIIFISSVLIKISLNEVKLGEDVYPLMRSGAESAQVLQSKTSSLYSQITFHVFLAELD